MKKEPVWLTHREQIFREGARVMSWTKEKVKEAFSKVYEKATTDAGYRQRMLADPYTAIKEVTGMEIPRAFKINVVDGSGYNTHFVLNELRTEDDELTESELETVVGGSKMEVASHIVEVEREFGFGKVNPIISMKELFL